MNEDYKFSDEYKNSSDELKNLLHHIESYLKSINQNRKIEELESKIHELETKIESLERQLGESSVQNENNVFPILNINTNRDVQNAMIELSKRDLLTAEDIANLQNSAWCAENFNLCYGRSDYAMLRPLEQGMLREFNANRYWAQPQSFLGREYYICSQWYDRNRPIFERWLREIVQR